MFEERVALIQSRAAVEFLKEHSRRHRDALLQTTLEIVRSRVRVFDIDMQVHAHSSYAFVRTGSSSTLMTLPTTG